MKHLNKNQKAFTLAEVLITLGIIGVVASLTIPNLIKNYQETSWKQAWKKEFSTLNQAYEMVKEEEGGDLSKYFTSETTYTLGFVVERLENHLSIIKKCNIPHVTDYNYACGTNPIISLDKAYGTLSGGYLNYHNINHGQYRLKNGVDYFFRPYLYSITVWVDVNGFNKKPNIVGKDFFCMRITENKIIPCGAQGTGLGNTCNSTEATCSYAYGFHGGSCAGAGCSAEALYK